MPHSVSSVRGLDRELTIDLGGDRVPGESCEHMMARIDRDEIAAICRHLLGDLGPDAPAGQGRR